MIYECAFRHAGIWLEIYETAGKYYIDTAYKSDNLVTQFSKKPIES